MLAGKIIALMTPFNLFLFDTGPDGADLAMSEQGSGEAAFTFDLVRGHIINRGQPFLEFSIIVSMGDKNSTNTAIETTWSCQFVSFFHILLLMLIGACFLVSA